MHQGLVRYCRHLETQLEQQADQLGFAKGDHNPRTGQLLQGSADTGDD